MFVVYTLVTILTHLHCRYYYFLHFVGTTSGFEFSVEIPSFMSQVTLGHGHLTFTESFTPLPYYVFTLISVGRRMVEQPMVTKALTKEASTKIPWLSPVDPLELPDKPLRALQFPHPIAGPIGIER